MKENFIFFGIIFAVLLSFFVLKDGLVSTFQIKKSDNISTLKNKEDESIKEDKKIEKKLNVVNENAKNPVKKVDTPDVLKAIYATMWSINSSKKRSYLYDVLNKTELNSIVIDVKDSSGKLAFDNVKSLEKVLSELSEMNVYKIARIAVFQDSEIAKTNPKIVLKTKDGKIWRDKKGYAWADPASKEAWDYVISISKKAIDIGFDEINYDYIRFPTDGDLDNIVYPFWDGKEQKSEVIRKFSEYSKNELKKHDPNVKLSMDIFGYTFLRGDGLGIGQKLYLLIDNFDYVYPMVYPSHYGAGNFGFSNPADYPYEVVNLTLKQGLDSLGEKKQEAKQKIRPWIQVFDLGAKYTPDMIKAQIEAVYDVLGKENTGWLMWSPSNNYDKVLEIEL